MAKREAPTCGGGQIPSRRPTNLRRRKLDDGGDNLPRARSSAKREGSRHLLPSCGCCTSRVTTPSWGAKRARTALNFIPTPTSLAGPSLRHHRRTDWSDLPDGPAGLIAERVLAHDLSDYVRFRAVCTAWRRCAADPREQGPLDFRFLPRRWIMLGEDDARPAAPHRRRFMNIATGRCVQVDLPEIQGHCLFQPTAEGLLVLVDERTLAVRLLNPFTRQITELPSLATLLPPERSEKTCCYADYLARGDLSVRAAGLAGEGMVALYFSGFRSRMLAVAKAGGERWMVVDRGNRFTSFMSFEGRFYCVSGCDVMTVETSENQPSRLVVAAQMECQSVPKIGLLCLVENGRELMAVHSSPVSSGKYEVCRVDLDATKLMSIHGLIDYGAVVTCSIRASSVCRSIYSPGFELSEKFIGYKIDDHLSKHGLRFGPWGLDTCVKGLGFVTFFDWTDGS